MGGRDACRRPPPPLLLPLLVAAAAPSVGAVRASPAKVAKASLAKELKLLRAEDKSFGADLFPSDEGRRRVNTLKYISQQLNDSLQAVQRHAPTFNWRRLSTGCKFMRMNWREKQRGGMRDDPLQLPMRTVDGTGVKRLPMERLQRLKLYNRTVIRAWVDDDCWNARRWVFVDLGARYFVRKKRPFYGSTFSFMCGYPGAERFEYQAFDINTDWYSSMYPPFVQQTAGAVWNSSGTIVIGGKGAGSFASLEEEEDDERPQAPGSASGRAPKEKDDGERRVPAVDFAPWLIERVKAEDYVVVKMDIENAEFRVIDRMFETGAMELVDEMFIECHGDLTREAYRKAGIKRGWVPAAWVRSEACVDLETRLRRHGVFLHEWD